MPQGILISSFFSISSSVDLEHTSNNLETRHLLLEYPRCSVFPGFPLSFGLFDVESWFCEEGMQPPPLSPCTRNKEPRSACNKVLTFCRILWHNDLTSNSLQISFTYKIQGDQKQNILRKSFLYTKILIFFFLINSKYVYRGKNETFSHNNYYLSFV